MAILKKDDQNELPEDIYYSGFYGFDKLKREIRGDGWFHGKACDYVVSKEKIVRERPRNSLINPMSDCYFAAPLRTVNLLRDSAAICHGPIGCGANLYLVSALYKTTRLLCTQMDENDVIMGGEAKLRQAIQEAYKRFKPEVIAVIGTCASSIIGDDIEGVCESMEAELGVPVIPFLAAGFKHRNWNIGFDESFNILIDRMKKKEPIKDTINYLNFGAITFHWKEVIEVVPYLTQLGLKINAHVPCSMTFQEMIDKFPRAALNVVRCPSVGFQTAEYAERVLGIPYARAPKPLSIKYTEDFINTIAQFFGRQKEAETLIEREKDRIKPRMEKVRGYLGGKRIAISAGPGKNIGLAQLAVELGMEVVYLSPLKTDTTYHELLRDFISSTEQDPEIMSEPSIYEEEAIMARLKPDIFIGLMEERAPISRLGIPCIDMEVICTPQLCGFEGAVVFGEYLVEVLKNKLFKNWGKYIIKNFPLYSSQKFLAEPPMALRSCERGKANTF